MYNPSFKALTFFSPLILALSKDLLVPNLRFDLFALIGSSTHNLKSFLPSFKILICSVLPNTYV